MSETYRSSFAASTFTANTHDVSSVRRGKKNRPALSIPRTTRRNPNNPDHISSLRSNTNTLGGRDHPPPHASLNALSKPLVEDKMMSKMLSPSSSSSHTVVYPIVKYSDKLDRRFSSNSVVQVYANMLRFSHSIQQSLSLRAQARLILQFRLLQWHLLYPFLLPDYAPAILAEGVDSPSSIYHLGPSLAAPTSKQIFFPRPYAFFSNLCSIGSN